MSQKSLNDEERGGNCLLVSERSYGPGCDVAVGHKVLDGTAGSDAGGQRDHGGRPSSEHESSRADHQPDNDALRCLLHGHITHQDTQRYLQL